MTQAMLLVVLAFTETYLVSGLMCSARFHSFTLVQLVDVSLYG